ncbi:nuclear transport factor 2 family protein [Pseudokineococcus basanitobsidens]|uniref:Nuclear transport factor 2 family protein n=1 Tax=Pseudokineococcus basanitobsidens TaxID=1926649 RepID=A0ABU8RPC7_9ACTN
MTVHPQTTETALTYHRAWTSGDMDAAMACVADDVTFDTPAGRLEGAEALRAFMEPFARGLTSSHVLGLHSTDDEAMLMYDTATVLVPSAPAAEWYRISEQRIRAGHIIFDRLPFALARGTVTPQQT